MTQPPPAAPGPALAQPAVAAASQYLNPGVTRREVWAWAMYDFANSGYTTVVLTTVFSVYFVGVVAGGAPWATLAWSSALSLSYLTIMLTMPALGARADARRGKRALLFTSTLGCLLATLVLTGAGPGDVWIALVAIVVSNYFYCVGESVVASFLPDLARPEALGRVSGWGWSFGYCGGLISLGAALLVVTTAQSRGMQPPQYVPWVLVCTCVLFGLSALPAFLLLRERARPPLVAQPLQAPSHSSSQAPSEPSAHPAGGLTVLRRLASSWRDTGRHFPQFHRLLACVACYQAGISVVITLSAVYAQQAMGFQMAQTMLLVLLVNIAAAAGAFGFGYLQDRAGHRRALAITLCGWVLMVLVAYSAVKPEVFWVAATLAGLCMGSSQSAGRAMVGAMAPQGRTAEFFALWTFAVQLAAVVGPLTYGVVTWLTQGNHRLAILATGLFFVGGLLLLRRIDMAAALRQRQAAGGMAG